MKDRYKNKNLCPKCGRVNNSFRAAVEFRHMSRLFFRVKCSCGYAYLKVFTWSFLRLEDMNGKKLELYGDKDNDQTKP